MANRLLVSGFTVLAIAAGAPAQARSTGGSLSPKVFMKAVDTNADKSISKDELDAYAKKRFVELETDNDKTLDDKELKGRLSAAGIARADTDKDKTVDEQEFVGYADKLFDTANNKNGKNDTTLSLRELGTPAGRKLIKLLH